MTESNIVYSTETGRVEQEKMEASAPKGDGIVRIHRLTKGKKGKGVSVITGLGLDIQELTQLATELKKRCACGGAVKEFDIEIQGDKRDLIKELLEERGFKVKLAGA